MQENGGQEATIGQEASSEATRSTTRAIAKILKQAPENRCKHQFWHLEGSNEANYFRFRENVLVALCRVHHRKIGDAVGPSRTYTTVAMMNNRRFELSDDWEGDAVRETFERRQQKKVRCSDLDLKIVVGGSASRTQVRLLPIGTTLSSWRGTAILSSSPLLFDFPTLRPNLDQTQAAIGPDFLSLRSSALLPPPFRLMIGR